ncbi:MAG: phenylpyruvate tautomerase MIF-related protein [Ruminococcus flavefaciens]
MPFIDVKTNVSVSEEQKNSIKTALGQAITAIPGKTESWLMVGIKPEYDLWFKGDKSAAAMVEVAIFGGASHNAFTTLTSHITGILTDQLGISSDRIYVKYSEVENWGWNGSNF